MATKPNPGCAIPAIKTPLKIDGFLKKLATDVVARALETEVVRTARQTKLVVDNKAAEIQAQADRLQKYKDLAEKFTKIHCPLPRVPDKVATTKTS